MPRTAIYALLLLFGTALWGFVPALAYMATGWRMDPILGWNGRDFSGFWLQAILLGCILGAWALLFTPVGERRSRDEEARIAAGISLLFLYLGYSLLNFQSLVRAHAGPAAPFEDAVWIFAVIGLVFLACFIKPFTGGWVLGTAVVFGFLLSPFLVRSFPLEGGLSDMFLAMEAAGRALLRGDPPYGSLPEMGDWYRCCYLPGLWLSFLPAVAVDLDPRYLNPVFAGLFAFLILRGVDPERRNLVSWFLVLFLLNPWGLIRHDTYFYAYLAVWGGFFLAVRGEKWKAAGFLYGLGLGFHTFSWGLLPIWVTWSVKRLGFREAGCLLARSLAVAALIILPFFLWDPAGFIEGNVTRWGRALGMPVSHLGLAVWLKPWPILMSALALLGLGAGVFAVWRKKADEAGLFRWLVASLALALLASFHVEHYYYFAPIGLMILHEAVRREGC